MIRLGPFLLKVTTQQKPKIAGIQPKPSFHPVVFLCNSCYNTPMKKYFFTPQKMQHVYAKEIGKMLKPMLLVGLLLVLSFLIPQQASAAAWDLSDQSYSQSKDISGQEGEPSGIAFNDDGTKMFLVGRDGDDVNEYDLSTGYDVSTAIYSQNSSVVTNPSGIAFNANGTKMFIVDNWNSYVSEYDLSSGFDVSTSVYSQNYTGIASDPTGIAFNTNGTRMFISGNSGNAIYQYNLGTGFDLSTASDSGNSSSVAGQEVLPNGVTFNSDGTKMFVTGFANNKVSEYNLSTAFDLSDTVTFSQDLDVSTEEILVEDVIFNGDGTKMFVTGSDGDAVYEYTSLVSAIPEFSNYIYLLTILVLVGIGYKTLPKLDLVKIK